jgi:hypothetical protein
MALLITWLIVNVIHVILDVHYVLLNLISVLSVNHPTSFNLINVFLPQNAPLELSQTPPIINVHLVIHNVKVVLDPIKITVFLVQIHYS